MEFLMQRAMAGKCSPIEEQTYNFLVGIHARFLGSVASYSAFSLYGRGRNEKEVALAPHGNSAALADMEHWGGGFAMDCRGAVMGIRTLRVARLLSRLKGNGKRKYKRYGPLPLRYAGGKSLAVGHVLERIPYGTRRVVSPFIGGASVEIACAKELGLEVMGYDIFKPLANYWHIQIEAPELLAAYLGHWKPDRGTYAKVKERLQSHWNKTARFGSALEFAAHYWFNHNLSYGPQFLGWMSSAYEDGERYGRAVARVRDFHCPNMMVKQGDFADTIIRHRGDFLYCDPPYYIGGDSKMFRGIYPQRNFPVHHDGFNHELLCELLKAHEGGFVLSYNDCSRIRELYSGFEISGVEWQHTLGQGETRIGANRRAAGRGHVKESHELLIVGAGKGMRPN